VKNGLILGLIAVMVPSLAWAQAGTAETPTNTQITAPALPKTPTSPLDFQGTAKGAAAPAAAAGAKGGAPTGYEGGDLLITDINPALYDAPGGRRKVPDHHTVKKGDTLWTLCQYYYGDPWAWPQLWAYNTPITNPHWIYPGDRIRMLGVVKQTDRTPDKEEVRLTKKARNLSRVMRLRQRGFVEEKEVAKSATVSGSLKERSFLSLHDELYLHGAARFKPTLGKLFTIYRIGRKLENRDGDHLGYLVLILGTARIKRLTKGKYATALVTEAFSEIQRGDRVGPLRRTYKAIPLRPAEKDLKGRIIANLDDIKGVGEYQVVYLDKGRLDGVKLGNRFLVMRQGDGAETLIPEEIDEEEMAQFPEETVAEISVLDVRKRASMGLVTRSLREVRNGDRVRMRRGY